VGVELVAELVGAWFHGHDLVGEALSAGVGGSVEGRRRHARSESVIIEHELEPVAVRQACREGPAAVNGGGAQHAEGATVDDGRRALPRRIAAAAVAATATAVAAATVVAASASDGE